MLPAFKLPRDRRGAQWTPTGISPTPPLLSSSPLLQAPLRLEAFASVVAIIGGAAGILGFGLSWQQDLHSEMDRRAAKVAAQSQLVGAVKQHATDLQRVEGALKEDLRRVEEVLKQQTAAQIQIAEALQRMERAPKATYSGWRGR